MKTFLSQRNAVWLVLTFIGAFGLILVPSPARALIGETPTIVMPAVDQNTTLRIAGTFTCKDVASCSLTKPIIEGRLTLINQTGFFDIFTVTVMVTDVLDPKSDPATFAFTALVVLKQLGAFSDGSVGSATLTLDCTNCSKGGRFTAATQCANNITMSDYVVQLADPRPDPIFILQ